MVKPKTTRKPRRRKHRKAPRVNVGSHIRVLAQPDYRGYPSLDGTCGGETGVIIAMTEKAVAARLDDGRCRTFWRSSVRAVA